jgi:hypothetical protein
MLGNDDCVNVGNVPLRGLDTYQKLGSQKKALVVFKDANHCFWATPVKGVCGYDICTSVPRLQQQVTGLKMFQKFATAVLDGSENAWTSFEGSLRSRKDGETGIEWEYAITSPVGSYFNITYQMCPKECCSDALAKMGLCKNNDELAQFI